MSLLNRLRRLFRRRRRVVVRKDDLERFMRQMGIEPPKTQPKTVKELNLDPEMYFDGFWGPELKLTKTLDGQDMTLPADEDETIQGSAD